MGANKVVSGFSLIAALFIAGCATYDLAVARGSPVRLNLSSPNMGKASSGDLTIYVEEYATPEKSEAVFDTRLVDEGLLPLLILVTNGGQEDYEGNATEIVLRGKTMLNALTSEKAASRAGRSAVGRALGWSMIVPIVSIPIAVVASATHTNKVNKQIVQDFVAKGFPSGVIMPGSERSGFVFFELEPVRKDLAGLSLEVITRNTTTREQVTIAAPLPAATFLPRREAGRQTDGEHKW